jgi:hypothetical protein
MPKDDTLRAEDFARLMPKRLEAALEKLRILGNLSSTYGYAYDADTVQQMIGELHAEVDRLEQEFVHGLRRQGYA